MSDVRKISPASEYTDDTALLCYLGSTPDLAIYPYFCPFDGFAVLRVLATIRKYSTVWYASTMH